jgi:hypothetical protein
VLSNTVHDVIQSEEESLRLNRMQNLCNDQDYGCRKLERAPEMHYFGKKESGHCRHNVFKLRKLIGSELW